MAFKQTPSQTVGPFFAYGLTPGQYGYDFTTLADGAIASEGMEGQHFTLTGRVLDGDGQPVDDAMIEIWQADPSGHYPRPGDNSGFAGFGRCGTGTDPLMRYHFTSVKPGSSRPGDAPCLNVVLFMRGLLNHVFTRVYFSDEEANATDPVLSALPAERQQTLIAQRLETPVGRHYQFDIHMQGPHETVFFDL